MSDKATVTNTSVSEPEDKTNVTNSAPVTESGKETENLRAELKRKTEVFQKELSEREDKIVRLERERQEREIALQAIQETQEEKIKREAKESAIHEISVNLTEDFIADKAAELKLKPAELAKELESIMIKDGRYRHLTPFQRSKNLFRDWQEMQSIAKEREEIRKEKEKLNSFSEGSGKENVFNSFADAQAAGSVIGQLKALGKY